VSGLSLQSFVFLGFPPASGAARREWLDTAAGEPRAVVFFESPHRMSRTRSELQIRLGKRQILTFRELTKIHEELVSNHIADEQVEEVGEFVCVLEPLSESVATSATLGEVESLANKFGLMTDTVGLSEDEALTALAAVSGVEARQLAKALKKARYARNRQREITARGEEVP
jgi:16S rRNA (cytidine1402-2'-O)-methyltransferase